jgi:hypothetical protein
MTFLLENLNRVQVDFKIQFSERLFHCTFIFVNPNPPTGVVIVYSVRGQEQERSIQEPRLEIYVYTGRRAQTYD